MVTDQPPLNRLRPTPIVVAAVAALIVAVAVFAVNLPAQRTAVVWAWLPAVIGAALAAAACWSAGRTPGLTRTLGRLWRQLAVVCALAGLGVVGDTRQAALHPHQAYGASRDALTALTYLMAMIVLLWALLRLPSDVRGPRERGARFVLDVITVTITVGVFAWYFTTHTLSGGVEPGHEMVTTIVLSALALIVPLGLIKIAASGLGGLEHGAVRLLALAAGVGVGGGCVFPLVVELRPGLGAPQIFLPATMMIVALAADRQRRVVALLPAARVRRSFSLVPYLAVAATDALLLTVSAGAGRGPLMVAAAAVCLTGIVVARQIIALRENGRLLRTVDASLLELNGFQEQLTHRANHDDLTDLANRALFEQRTRESLAGADGQSLSLALIDLDDFKAINDRLGHAVGDALLVVVAQRLRDCVRANDVVARLGGDEFGLLLPGLRGDEATEVLDRISEALTRPVHALGYDLLVRASVGLAEVWPDASPQELLRRADLAMYAAKERGKGRHAVYDTRLERHQAADAELGAALRQALDNDEFTLVYQPIVALPTGAWTGVETLIRWHSPERGVVGPDTFIPIAERTGLIVPLGDWILRTALRQGVAWDRRYGAAAPFEVGVNVSARQLREPGFAGDVRRALAETGFDPERLVVEVTETAVFDGGMALETLRELVGLGVKIALDDFGTGHSSLGLLRTCPVDVLKVDKSFVDGIGGRSEEGVIATAMIQITNGLHLAAIAEGVETAEQAETLHRLGYRFAQGYHFSRPLPPEQIDAELAKAELAKTQPATAELATAELAKAGLAESAGALNVS